MRQWSSFEEIVEAFGLRSDSTYRVARAQLLKKLSTVHPDNTSGEFPSEETENRYYEIKNAINHIDGIEKRSGRNLPSTIGERKFLLPDSSRADEIRSSEAAISSGIDRIISARYFRQRIGSAAVAAAVSGTLVFSEKILSNRLISKFFAYLDTHLPLMEPALGFLLLIVLIIALIVFASAWTWERREKALAEALLTDQGISNIFKAYPIFTRINDAGEFSSNDLHETIQSQREYTQRWFVKYTPKYVRNNLPTYSTHYMAYTVFKTDPGLFRRVCDLILAKLEARGAISVAVAGSLVPIYKLSDAALKQLGLPLRRTQSGAEPI